MCTNCNQTTYKPAFYGPYQPCIQPQGCGDCNTITDSTCVVYTGSQLNNLGLDTNVCLETIIQEINEQLAVTTGNYAGYNTACLAPIITQKQFVETISQFVCDTQDQLTTFVSNTYPSDIESLQDQIDNINSAGFTSCAAIGISPTDTIQQALVKISGVTCNINSSIDLSTANWNSCFTVVGPNPITPLQATNALLAQICSVKASITNSVLPTFNNVGTCISGGTATDSLVTTVTAVRDLVCTKPSLNINSLSFGCVAKPSMNATDLQGTLQNLLTNVSNLNNKQVVFDPSQFTTTLIDNMNPCLGVTVSLSADLTPTDRLVAVDNADSSPGTLVDKLIEGTGVTLDTSTNPGTMIINVDTTGIASDGKVKADSLDPTADYLINKVVGFTDTASGLNINPTLTVDHRVQMVGQIDLTLLTQAILTAIGGDDDLKSQLCALIATCSITCAPPTNVTVTTE